MSDDELSDLSSDELLIERDRVERLCLLALRLGFTDDVRHWRARLNAIRAERRRRQMRAWHEATDSVEADQPAD